ncbi:hypothetical protein [uncultured Shewanella sp.]|uniref:hypothetical protein n=1 Tax=uncultured Shewanella sp. TaxID=173975 RepID=UPI00260AE749|nr:hypothetical protein [uncultured Shewanella sp.]
MRLQFLLICLVATSLEAKDCSLPDVLTNKRIILVIDLFYQPSNPKAGNLHELTLSKDKINDTNLSNKEASHGSYQYNRLNPTVAVLSYQLTLGKELTESKFVFACDSNRTGKYIYSQIQGSVKPNVRQNTGSYIITNIEKTAKKSQ